MRENYFENVWIIAVILSWNGNEVKFYIMIIRNITDFQNWKMALYPI